MNKPNGIGIIAVANHRLAVDGVEAYRKELNKEYLNQEDVLEELNSVLFDSLDSEMSEETYNAIESRFWSLINNLGLSEMDNERYEKQKKSD